MSLPPPPNGVTPTRKRGVTCPWLARRANPAPTWEESSGVPSVQVIGSEGALQRESGRDAQRPSGGRCRICKSLARGGLFEFRREDIMAETQLTLTAEEQDYLVSLLETVLKDT